MVNLDELTEGDKFTYQDVLYEKLGGDRDAVALSGEWKGDTHSFRQRTLVKQVENISTINHPSAMRQLLDDMCERMAANDDMWKDRSLGDLLRRIQEELGELIQCLCNQESAENVRDEAADVANFLWMLVDVYEAKLK